jgi:putative flippase GtrA
MRTSTAGIGANSCKQNEVRGVSVRAQGAPWRQAVEGERVAAARASADSPKPADSASAGATNCCAVSEMRAGGAGAAHSFSRKVLGVSRLRGWKRRAAGQKAGGKRNESTGNARVATLIRWGKFNLVGAIGILVQFAALFFLKGVLHLNYLAATALAVEIAVVHNFVWHERYTWAERAPSPSGAKALGSKKGFIAALKRCATQNLRAVQDLTNIRDSGAVQSLCWLRFRRFLRFNLTAGAVSILGNLGMMRFMVGVGHMNYLVANGIAIAVCSLVNFVVCDDWVFGE